MAQPEYKSRLVSDFRKTFGTRHGKHVLMHFYTHLFGSRTTYQPGSAPEQTFVNEGMRMAWLMFDEYLKVSPEDLIKEQRDYLEERKRIENSQPEESATL